VILSTRNYNFFDWLVGGCVLGASGLRHQSVAAGILPPGPQKQTHFTTSFPHQATRLEAGRYGCQGWLLLPGRRPDTPDGGMSAGLQLMFPLVLPLIHD